MPVVSMPQFNDREHRSLERILDGFDKIQNRADSQYGRVRKHDRKPYRGLISIYLPPNATDTPPKDYQDLPIGWAYSLSLGGIGFLSLEVLESYQLWIGLHLPTGNIKWMNGLLVRRREIPEERFLDYGVAFGNNH